MARYHNGLLSGKAGDMVYSIRNGVNYANKASKHSYKTPSQKQKIQREKFGIATRFLSPLSGILNENYRKTGPKSFGLSKAIKQVLATAIIGEYPDLKLDYSNVTIVSGSLAYPEIENIYLCDNNELRLFWQVVLKANSFLNDELFAIIYCPQIPEKWLRVNPGIIRAEQAAAIKLPGQLVGQAIHVWLAYRSEMMDSFSDSVYMGQFFPPKQDRHGNY